MRLLSDEIYDEHGQAEQRYGYVQSLEALKCNVCRLKDALGLQIQLPHAVDYAHEHRLLLASQPKLPLLLFNIEGI